MTQCCAVLRGTTRHCAVLRSAAQYCAACSSAVPRTTARSVNAALFCCYSSISLFSNSSIISVRSYSHTNSRISWLFCIIHDVDPQTTSTGSRRSEPPTRRRRIDNWQLSWVELRDVAINGALVTRLYVHLKKWTLKFKLLYLLNHMNYFNKIYRICGLNPRLYKL